MNDIFNSLIFVGFFVGWLIFLIRGYNSEKHETRKDKIQHMLLLTFIFLLLVFGNVLCSRLKN